MGNDASKTREQGIEFGTLIEDLEDESFPLAHEALLDRYGDRELGLADEQVRLREVLSPKGEHEQEQEQDHQEEYQDVGGVEQAVFNMVGEEAVGRKGYTDRGGNPKDIRESTGAESS